jgi:hypothetical protein
MSEHSTLSELFERFDASSVTQGTTGRAASNFLPSVGPGLSRTHTNIASGTAHKCRGARGGRIPEELECVPAWAALPS